MYCNKCGKFTETEDILCADCKAKEQQQTVNAVVSEPCSTTQPVAAILPRPSNGFGVAAMVLGLVAFVMAVLGYLIAEPGYEFDVLIVLLFAHPALIIALVNGIKAVVVFVKACKNKQAKPVAGFVMGIIGLNLVMISLILFDEAFMYCM